MPVVFHKAGKTFEVEDCFANLNLLAHAQMIELDIGSECGGHGICGKDRVKLDPSLLAKHQVSAPSEEEEKHLTVEELAQGWRLACQCYPEKDALTIDATTFQKA